MAYFRAGTARATHEAQQITVAKTPLATFESNVSGLYIPEILAYIQATQSGSGDPSPINPRAISGVTQVDTTVCGVNIWDEQWEVGGISSSTGQNTTATNRIRSKNYIRVSPQTQYYFKTSNSFRVFYYTATKEFIDATNTVAGNFIFTTPDGVHYMRFILVTDTFVQNDVSINYPATDTAYHAYTGTTATTDLGGTYYGGYVNVPTGLMTVTHRYFSFNEAQYYGTYGVDDANLYYCEFSDYTDNPIVNVASSSYEGDIFSNMFTKITTTSRGMKNGEFRTNNSPTPNMFYFRADSFADLTAVNAFLANTPMQVVAELQTPQTVQLTPQQIEQLLGQNNVFCSSGDVAVKFWRID